MRKPKVSILCLTYNHEKFISQALDSFLMQKTNFSFEIIVHDDASTDSTQKIIRTYQKKYPKIIKVIFQKENLYSKGVRGITFKYLFPKAKGKYIALCEGDDYWTDKNKLQIQVDILDKQQNFSGVFHKTQLIYENGDLGKIYGDKAPSIIGTADTISPESPFHTSSLLFRRNCIDTPKWIYKVISKDMALFSILTFKGNLYKINKIMSVYRKHSKGITSSAEITNNFHRDRIILTNYLNSYHNYKYNRKVQGVIAFHKREFNVKEKTNFLYLKHMLDKFLIFINYVYSLIYFLVPKNNLRGNTLSCS